VRHTLALQTIDELWKTVWYICGRCPVELYVVLQTEQQKRASEGFSSASKNGQVVRNLKQADEHLTLKDLSIERSVRLRVVFDEASRIAAAAGVSKLQRSTTPSAVSRPHAGAVYVLKTAQASRSTGASTQKPGKATPPDLLDAKHAVAKKSASVGLPPTKITSPPPILVPKPVPPCSADTGDVPTDERASPSMARHLEETQQQCLPSHAPQRLAQEPVLPSYNHDPGAERSIYDDLVGEEAVTKMGDAAFENVSPTATTIAAPIVGPATVAEATSASTPISPSASGQLPQCNSSASMFPLSSPPAIKPAIISPSLANTPQAAGLQTSPATDAPSSRRRSGAAILLEAAQTLASKDSMMLLQEEGEDEGQKEVLKSKALTPLPSIRETPPAATKSAGSPRLYSGTSKLSAIAVGLDDSDEEESVSRTQKAVEAELQKEREAAGKPSLASVVRAITFARKLADASHETTAKKQHVRGQPLDGCVDGLPRASSR
jgi:hypothetical protein